MTSNLGGSYKAMIIRRTQGSRMDPHAHQEAIEYFVGNKQRSIPISLAFETDDNCENHAAADSDPRR